MPNPRVVSLIASSTEMVCALGRGDCLVGRSHECDHPDWVRRLPQVTAPKLALDGSSYQIDQRVHAILEQGMSVYRVDAVALARLAPDVIVTQTQCDACAVSLRDLERAACDLIPSRPRIVALEPNRLADIWRDFERVAVALGVADRGAALVRSLKSRMDEIARAALTTPRRRVALVEWIEPLMVAGNWHPELVTMANAENLLGVAGEHAPAIDWETFRASDPDIIVVAPCGFDLTRTRTEMPALRALPGWAELRAVRSGQVVLADGNGFFNRPGPRVVETLEILAEFLHPERFRFGHEGTAWMRDHLVPPTLPQ